MATLDASLPESQKALRTEQLANQWERHSPLPVQVQAPPPVDKSYDIAMKAPERIKDSTVSRVQPMVMYVCLFVGEQGCVVTLVHICTYCVLGCYV